MKPFYMKGNGAFAKVEKKPKVKMDCRGPVFGVDGLGFRALVALRTSKT